jgi:hypothetical protein
MTTNNLIPIPTFDSPFELAETTTKMAITDVFAERCNPYLNEFSLFVVHFNSIPNYIHEININCRKAITWFLDCYKTEIKDIYYKKRYFNRSIKAEIDIIFYFL